MPSQNWMPGLPAMIKEAPLSIRAETTDDQLYQRHHGPETDTVRSHRMSARIVARVIAVMPNFDIGFFLLRSSLPLKGLSK